MSSSPVSPELLDHVMAFAAQIASGEKPSKHIDKLIVCCDNFFLQFFQNHLKAPITGIDASNKAKAIRVRLQPRTQALPVTTLALVKWFERLCDIEPDLKALSYDEDDNPALPDFLRNFVPTFLERALAWATAEELADLAAKIRHARDVYVGAIAKLDL